MALTTLEEVRTYMGYKPAQVEDNALLEMLRAGIEELVIQHCDTDFEQKTVVRELHDGISSDVIVPYHFPVVSIDDVYFYGADYDYGILLVPGVDYYVDDDGSIILRTRSTPFARGSVGINYKHGYTSVPAVVKLAVYQAIKAEMQRKKANTENISSRSKEGESEGYNAAWDRKSGLPTQILSKLAAFRVNEFPNAAMAQRNY